MVVLLERLPGCSIRSHPPLALGRQGRPTAVRRIGEERAPELTVDDGDGGAPFEIDVVVPAPGSSGLAA
ncbi:MAG: hypothetical protein V3R68_07010, partial [Gammaproteobacteria bacterium]